MATMTKITTEDGSLLDKLDDLVPAPLAQFDAFPKLPATYKARSESRGFLTLFVALAALLLVLNDLGEFVWGWTDYEFGVDIDKANTMDINVDMVVNMPCQCECLLGYNSLASHPAFVPRDCHSYFSAPRPVLLSLCASYPVKGTSCENSAT